MGVGDDVAPRFTQKPALKQEDGGQRLVFQCALEASPKPDIAWFRGTTPLTSSDRLRMRVDSAGGSAYNVIMEIIGVTQGDAGTYKVTAKNRLGEVSASINLNFSGQCDEGLRSSSSHHISFGKKLAKFVCQFNGVFQFRH
jgi:hypothetical protein